MMELPEAATIARQMNETVPGRQVQGVTAAHTHHGFAFYSQDPALYEGLLKGRAIGHTEAVGGFVQVPVGDKRLLLGDGIRVRLYGKEEKRPDKHQLLLELSGGDALVCSVQMYGGMWVMEPGQCDNPYYNTAAEKPSPLGDAFSEAYFMALARGAKQTLSAKAFLATEQRVPGLGNGVLQDILFHARIHPKKQIGKLAPKELEAMYRCVKEDLAQMAQKNGRNTEKDLFGQAGGYEMALHAKTAGKPCPVCGTVIQKQAYLGGSIYFCPACQPL